MITNKVRINRASTAAKLKFKKNFFFFFYIHCHYETKLTKCQHSLFQIKKKTQMGFLFFFSTFFLFLLFYFIIFFNFTLILLVCYLCSFFFNYHFCFGWVLWFCFVLFFWYLFFKCSSDFCSLSIHYLDLYMSPVRQRLHIPVHCMLQGIISMYTSQTSASLDKKFQRYQKYINH